LTSCKPVSFSRRTRHHGVSKRDWRRIGCPKRSSLTNWEGREKGKTQEKMERGSRNRSSSAGSEKMERAGGRKKWKGIVRQAKAHSVM